MDDQPTSGLFDDRTVRDRKATGRVAMVRAHQLVKLYHARGSDDVRGLFGLNLVIEPNEVVTMFGPNGCGKTTLLNLIAGLQQPDRGWVRSEVGELHSLRKSYVWQNYRESLLPWRNVEDNIAFPLELQGNRRMDRLHRVQDLLKVMRLDLDPRARVYNLSGGQQQIVCLLRALIVQPQLLLLDEPFSALDYYTSLAMQELLLRLWDRMKPTTILVSHDLDQAILLGDRLVLLEQGQVQTVVEIDLPRPRTVAMLTDPRHLRIKREILAHIERTRRR